MYDYYEIYRQRHDEMLREARITRLARRHRIRVAPALLWEAQRYAGRMLKHLRRI
jgi:hypothetical protein